MQELSSKTDRNQDAPDTTANELDHLDARKWSRKKKVLTTWVISLFKFISGLTSTSVVPNLHNIALEFGTRSRVLKIFPLSSYFLGYIAGLLIIGPLSENFGRVGMLQASNILFIVFNTAAGFSKTNTQIVVMRVLSGLGGPLSVCLRLDYRCYQ